MDFSNQQDDKKSDRHRLQFELVTMESDYQRFLRKKEILAMELTQLKRRKVQIEVDIENKNLEMRKLDTDAFMLSNNINSLRKKINFLK